MAIASNSSPKKIHGEILHFEGLLLKGQIGREVLDGERPELETLNGEGLSFSGK